MILLPIFALLIGFVLGIAFTYPSREVDLEKENIKLRNENEVLWDRIRKTENIDFTA